MFIENHSGSFPDPEGGRMCLTIYMRLRPMSLSQSCCYLGGSSFRWNDNAVGEIEGDSSLRWNRSHHSKSSPRAPGDCSRTRDPLSTVNCPLSTVHCQLSTVHCPSIPQNLLIPQQLLLQPRIVNILNRLIFINSLDRCGCRALPQDHEYRLHTDRTKGNVG